MGQDDAGLVYNNIYTHNSDTDVYYQVSACTPMYILIEDLVCVLF
jgi:hypothetical protein